MRALRTSVTAPTSPTSTAPIKKYLSTNALFQISHGRGESVEQNLEFQVRFRLSGSCVPLPQEPGQSEAVLFHAIFSERLRDVVAERLADAKKRVVDVLRKRSHCDHGGEGNQGQDQCVLHQSLARFVSVYL